MNKFKKIFKFLYGLKLKYIFSRSIVVAYGKVTIGKNVRIKRSKIVVNKNSSLSIADNCFFDRTLVSLEGQMVVGEGNFFEQKGSSHPLEIVGKGNLIIGNRNRIRAKIWVRFGGKVEIANYTNINEGSEIRCDDSVQIGSYNQISYNVMIWDTNTHNIYPSEKRRKMAEEYYPIFGVEFEKPSTKQVFIGDDCWLGKDVTLLKGTTLNDKCVVGFRTLLSNITIEPNTTVFLDISTKQYKNNI